MSERNWGKLLRAGLALAVGATALHGDKIANAQSRGEGGNLDKLTEVSDFLPDYKIGYDIPLHELVVLDSENHFVGPFGDGNFDNGVDVTIIYHLRGGKVKDVPRAWGAKDQKGNRVASGQINAGFYSSEPPSSK